MYLKNTVLWLSRANSKSSLYVFNLFSNSVRNMTSSSSWRRKTSSCFWRSSTSRFKAYKKMISFTNPLHQKIKSFPGGSLQIFKNTWTLYDFCSCCSKIAHSLSMSLNNPKCSDFGQQKLPMSDFWIDNLIFLFKFFHSQPWSSVFFNVLGSKIWFSFFSFRALP